MIARKRHLKLKRFEKFEVVMPSTILKLKIIVISHITPREKKQRHLSTQYADTGRSRFKLTLWCETPYLRKIIQVDEHIFLMHSSTDYSSASSSPVHPPKSKILRLSLCRATGGLFFDRFQAS